MLVVEKTSVRTAEGPGPKDKTLPRSQKRGRVRVFRNWCKGCGLCIAFCPQQVYAEGEEHRPVVVHPERCTACRWCAIHCPDFAILVELVEGNGGEVAK